MKKLGWSLVSAVALTLLVVGTVLGVDRQVPWWLTGEPEALQLNVADPVLEPSAAEPASLPEPAPAEPAAEEVAEPTGPVMPDLSRMRVDRAFRAMRTLGLRLRATDSYRNPIERVDGRWFGVRSGSQSVEPGTPVEPGQVVRVRTYEIAESFGDGY